MRSDVQRIRSGMTKRVSEGRSWLYSRTEAGTWVRASFNPANGYIVVEYQPQVVVGADRVTIYNLDGEAEMSMRRGVALVDVPQEEWRQAAALSVDLIDDLDVFSPNEHYRVIRKIRDTIFIMILLGFGKPAQQVADWFITPSYGEWIKGGVPYTLNSGAIGLGRAEVSDVRCNIEGLVSFAMGFIDDEIDFSLTWDRFLLAADIDTKEAIDEIY